MKFPSIIFLAAFAWITVTAPAQDLNTPLILHISTLTNNSAPTDSTISNPLVKGGLVVLSLTSVDLFEHFDRDVDGLKKQYQGNKLIVAVDRDGTSEKSEFMVDFYKLSVAKKSTDVFRDAFDEALKNIKTKYGDIHFKAAMYDLTKRKKE